MKKELGGTLAHIQEGHWRWPFGAFGCIMAAVETDTSEILAAGLNLRGYQNLEHASVSRICVWTGGSDENYGALAVDCTIGFILWIHPCGIDSI